MRTRFSRWWCAPVVLLAACDEGPVATRASRMQPGYLMTEFTCTVTVRSGTTECRSPQLEAARGGPQLNILPGEPSLTFVNSWVHSRGNAANEDTSTNTLSFVNNMGQPIGTIDGVNAHPDGNRLFLAAAPTVTDLYSGSSGSVQLVNPDGTASFDNPEGTSAYSNRPYFQYSGMVARSATSGSRAIRFVYSANVESFSYTFRLSTPVQYEYGWVDVFPATPPALFVGEVYEFWGSPYSAYGVPQWEAVTWSSSNPYVATVNSAGEVTAVAAGTATITATSTANGLRKGTRLVTVDARPSVLIPPTTTIAPGDNLVVGFSEPVNVSAASFALECPAGPSRTFAVSGSGTSTVTVNPDGDLPAGATCALTVIAAQVTDADANDGPDQMYTDQVLSYPVAAGLAVTGTTPANGAFEVPPEGNLTITFNRPVTVSTSSFTIHCTGGRLFAVTGSGTSTITLNPYESLPAGDTCTVTVLSANVTDANGVHPSANHVFSFHVEFVVG